MIIIMMMMMMIITIIIIIAALFQPEKLYIEEYTSGNSIQKLGYCVQTALNTSFALSRSWQSSVKFAFVLTPKPDVYYKFSGAKKSRMSLYVQYYDASYFTEFDSLNVCWKLNTLYISIFPLFSRLSRGWIEYTMYTLTVLVNYIFMMSFVFPLILETTSIYQPFFSQDYVAS